MFVIREIWLFAVALVLMVGSAQVKTPHASFLAAALSGVALMLAVQPVIRWWLES